LINRPGGGSGRIELALIFSLGEAGEEHKVGGTVVGRVELEGRPSVTTVTRDP